MEIESIIVNQLSKSGAGGSNDNNNTRNDISITLEQPLEKLTLDSICNKKPKRVRKPRKKKSNDVIDPFHLISGYQQFDEARALVYKNKTVYQFPDDLPNASKKKAKNKKLCAQMAQLNKDPTRFLYPEFKVKSCICPKTLRKETEKLPPKVTQKQPPKVTQKQPQRKINKKSSEEPQKVRLINNQNVQLVEELFDEKKTHNILELQIIFFKYVSNNLKPDTEAKKKDGLNTRKSFPDYYTMEEVETGIQNGTIFIGIMRVKNGKMSYVTSADYGEDDIPIEGWKNRNRALDTDIVAVELDKTMNGRIVHILQENHPRKCVGTIKNDYLGKTFYPKDVKVPRMTISNYGSFRIDENDPHIYYVEIVKYEFKEPECRILTDIGSYSSFMAQYESILFENSLDLKPLSLDTFVSQIIPPTEYETRADFRKTCVFSIDPATARDLDDAVSCTLLENGNYEVGVHISDVTYYLNENTSLDKEVSEKATTIYLIDKTYHMLPEELCLTCSLLPGIDKLSYSVIWEITKDGQILNHRFTRSVINSCCQLSYDHAQKIIENPNCELNPNDFPPIKGDFTLNDIKSITTTLHKLATIFKQRRIDGGSLRINQSKIYFTMNPQLTYQVEVAKESNSLIEELMLLANQTVAKRIFDDFPDIAFLRRHSRPKSNLKRLAAKLKVNGFDLDIKSAGTLQASLSRYNLNDKKQWMHYHVLQRNLVKTLARADYFCTSNNTNYTSHYALNVDLYTHFTSPIRRYADVMVHRLLSASLGYSPKPAWTEKYVQDTAERCNTKKSNAKNASDMSIKLYFLKYISINSPVFYEACIVDIFETGIEIIIPDAGFADKILYEAFSEEKCCINFKRGDEKFTPDVTRVEWSCGTGKATQTLQIFSIINVVLKKSADIMKLDIFVLPPFNVPSSHY